MSDDARGSGPVSEDPDLGSLFDATRIHADEAGVYHDEDGREYRAVEVDGELTFEPLVPPETYLGDAVTASFDGYHIVLKANGGAETIYLDPGVYAALVRYADKVYGTGGSRLPWWS